MSVVLLDPRFPNMIPVDAVDLLRGDVCYTEEVPIRVRWVIADLGGHTVDESEILVTTDPENETVQFRLEQGETMITAPSLQVHLEPTRELESGEARGGVAPEEKDEETVTHSGGVVDGEIVGTDDHTVAVAGLRRTTRTEVPASVMDEVEDAIAIMARALRQGEWEQAMTHTSLMDYLRAETEELGYIVAQLSELEDGGSGRFGGDGTAPQWLEQELCAELSDVLLQVLFHAEIANRRGAFDIGHVAGAFVAKMRSRAPYLFEEVERQVPRTEQDRLWAAGKEREREEKAERLGEKYHEFVARKDAAPAASGTGSASPSTATAPATSTAPGDTAPGAPATA
ncbi:MAG TPA: hypothetical protein H9867_00985, partial [Candidatus Corynebacterium gallistercoris]|nr:hypothetical protein [Candidatus Corynebacterium gallistercoris]